MLDASWQNGGSCGGSDLQWTDDDGRIARRDWIREDLGVVIEAEGFTPLIDLDVPNQPGRAWLVSLAPEFEVTIELDGPRASRAEGARVGYSQGDSNVHAWILHGRHHRSQRPNPDVVLSEHRVENGRVILRGFPRGDFRFFIQSDDTQLVSWRERLEGPTTRRVEVPDLTRCRPRSPGDGEGQPGRVLGDVTQLPKRAVPLRGATSRRCSEARCSEDGCVGKRD